jgi:hypothetical protein
MLRKLRAVPLTRPFRINLAGQGRSDRLASPLSLRCGRLDTSPSARAVADEQEDHCQCDQEEENGMHDKPENHGKNSDYEGDKYVTNHQHFLLGAGRSRLYMMCPSPPVTKHHRSSGHPNPVRTWSMSS